MANRLQALFDRSRTRRARGLEAEFTRPVAVMGEAPNGPITVERTRESITATDRHDLTVVIGASDWPDPITKEELVGGIPIHLDNELIGRFVLEDHDRPSSERTLNIKPIPGNDLLSEGLHYRERSTGVFSLENSEGNWVIRGGMRSEFASSADDLLICLHAIAKRILSDLVS